MSHVSALLGLLFSQKTPHPSLASLLRRPSLIERDFLEKSAISTHPKGEYLEVRINGEIFLWPVGMDLESLLRSVAEQSELHPHKYDWGNTRIAKDDVVIDIGACEGSFSVYAASRGSQVVAVEPCRKMIALVEKLFELRHLARPVLINKLIGSSTGEAYFCVDSENIAASKIVPTPIDGSYPLEVVTLDRLVQSLNLQRVDFIKCDAEGADVEIIKSGKETLRRFRPKIAVTTYHADDHFRVLAEYLSGLGYRIRGKGYIYIHGIYRPVMLHAN
jgi:FkbM family methyltransferase